MILKVGERVRYFRSRPGTSTWFDARVIAFSKTGKSVQVEYLVNGTLVRSWVREESLERWRAA